MYLFGASAGFQLVGKGGFDPVIVMDQAEHAAAFSDCAVVLSAGTLASAVLLLPLGFLNLDENISAQWVSCGAFLAATTILTALLARFGIETGWYLPPMIGSELTMVAHADGGVVWWQGLRGCQLHIKRLGVCAGGWRDVTLCICGHYAIVGQ